MGSKPKDIDDVTSEDLNEITKENEDVVKYETYKKVLSQHKRSQQEALELKQRLDVIEKREREREEALLTEQGEYKKLLELERKRSEEKSKEAERSAQMLLETHKLNAFREKLPGKLKHNSYYSFVPTDSIVIDPESGIIDDNSLSSVVSDFLKHHSALVESPSKKDLPWNASTNSSRLSYEEWLKLPVKEQKSRYKEMRQNDLNK